MRNPKNADAFLQLGQQAQEAGRTQLARLSYEAFLRLAPDDSNAAAVKERLTQLSGTGAQTTPRAEALARASRHPLVGWARRGPLA